jgi:hypothetical protein
MKEHSAAEAKMSSAVLSLETADVAPFVEKSLRERSLSKVVADLNRDLLFGDRTEREEAVKALKHIGFM